MVTSVDIEAPAFPTSYSVLLIERLARTVKSRLERALAPLGLRVRHLVALSYLRDHGPTPQGALGDGLRIDPSNLVGLLNDLDDQGLVVRRRDPADRRRHIVEPPRADRSPRRGRHRTLQAVDDDVLDARSRTPRRLHCILMRVAGELAALCLGDTGSPATMTTVNCTHLDTIEISRPAAQRGGLRGTPAHGSTWVHLRMCSGGKIGCCDSCPTGTRASTPWRQVTRSSARSSRARTGAGAWWTRSRSSSLGEVPPIYLNTTWRRRSRWCSSPAGQQGRTGADYGDAPERLAAEIDEDRRAQRLMKQLGVRSGRSLLASAVGEKLGRFKLNGIDRYCPQPPRGSRSSGSASGQPRPMAHAARERRGRGRLRRPIQRHGAAPRTLRSRRRRRPRLDFAGGLPRASGHGVDDHRGQQHGPGDHELHRRVEREQVMPFEIDRHQRTEQRRPRAAAANRLVPLHRACDGQQQQVAAAELVDRQQARGREDAADRRHRSSRTPRSGCGSPDAGPPGCPAAARRSADRKRCAWPRTAGDERDQDDDCQRQP